MPNLFDYLTWRGDLPIADVPLCEIDYLLFAEISYVAFGELVPRDRATVGEAARALLKEDPDAEKIAQTPYLWKDNRAMLEKLALCGRFQNVVMTRRADEWTSDMQFAAVTFHPGDGSAVVAYRGTDATLVGWEEDFLMALNEPVPSQKRALAYLEEAAAEVAGDIAVVGHSKGGNLGIYAAAFCREDAQARVRAIYNFDGPGFPFSLIDTDGYRRVRDRLRVYQPQGSIIGQLLEHEKAYATVQAKSLGLLQHNAFNWQISGREFIRAERPTQVSSFFGEVMHDWLDELNNEQRAEFVRALFSVVRALDVDSLNDINLRLIPKLPAVISRMISIPNEQKLKLLTSFLKLGGTAVSTLVQPVMEKLGGQGGEKAEE